MSSREISIWQNLAPSFTFRNLTYSVQIDIIIYHIKIKSRDKFNMKVKVR